MVGRIYVSYFVKNDPTNIDNSVGVANIRSLKHRDLDRVFQRMKSCQSLKYIENKINNITHWHCINLV